MLDYVGSSCPITLGHVQCVVEAHKILTGDSPPLGDVAFKTFAASIVPIWVNGDSFVSENLTAKGEKAMSRSGSTRVPTPDTSRWAGPSQTQLVLDGIRMSKISAKYCRVGPKLPDSSSSKDARVALTQRDTHKLATLLHPWVTEWCQPNGPWRDD